MEELKVEAKPASWMQCPRCSCNFNCKGRLPIYLICCGKTACLECVESQMNKSNQRGMSIKGKFKCGFCEADHCG